MDWDYGDVPTWVAAFGGLLALVFAAKAASAAKNVFDIESERDRQAATERTERDQALRSSQAVRVSAWFEKAGPIEEPGGYVAYFQNASEAPVYDVTIDFRRTGGESRSMLGVPLIAPTPGGPRVFPPPRELRISEVEPLDDFEVAIKFTDTGNVRWHRDVKGRLVEIGDAMS